MAYPTSTELKLMDVAFQGQPFVQVPAGSALSAGLDLAALAQPYSATDLTAPVGGGGPVFNNGLMLMGYGT